MTTPTTYTSSDGTIWAISHKGDGQHEPMNNGHLFNSLKKAERAFQDGVTMNLVTALRNEVNERKAAGIMPDGNPGVAGIPGERSIMPKREAAPKREAPAPIGDNRAPADAPNPINDRLTVTYSQLLEDIAQHELNAATLPRTCETEDDVTTIGEWVKKSRGLWRAAETKREEEKADYLKAGRTVDAFFAGLKDNLASRAKAIEARATAFLEAREKRRIAEEAAAKEKAALDAQREADEKARAAEEEIFQAETDEEREAAEIKARDAFTEAANAGATAQAVQAQAIADEKKADRAEARAEDPHKLARVSGGGAGASVSLRKSWTGRVVDRTALVTSLGPLGAFLSAAEVDKAVERAAKSPARPPIPGVEYVEQSAARTY